MIVGGTVAARPAATRIVAVAGLERALLQGRGQLCVMVGLTTLTSVRRTGWCLLLVTVSSCDFFVLQTLGQLLVCRGTEASVSKDSYITVIFGCLVKGSPAVNELWTPCRRTSEPLLLLVLL